MVLTKKQNERSMLYYIVVQRSGGRIADAWEEGKWSWIATR